jgi:RNA polymerase sigma-70 factor (ECF subfamily)
MTDAERFEDFVRSYQHMVFGVAVRLLGDAAEAEDVAQTVFLRAFERFDALRPGAATGAWLRTVATNLCLNHLSRFRRRWRPLASVRSPDGDGEPLFDPVAPGETAHDALVRVERAARLEQALRALPAHQRVPLVLYHFEERSYQEIAEALGISLAKLKTDIHRGREALRQELDDVR